MFSTALRHSSIRQHTVLNIFIKHTGSTGAVPATTYFLIVFVWFLVSIPLAFAGGYFAKRVRRRVFSSRLILSACRGTPPSSVATRADPRSHRTHRTSLHPQAPFIDPPTKTNQIPRQIPPPPLVAHPALLFLSAGKQACLHP